MKVTRGETENRQTVLHIEVDSLLVERHLQRAHQKVAARVNIPGFRKGKAPRSVVERFVGSDYLLDEALETIVPDAVSEAIKEVDISPSATPRVSIAEREPIVKLDATVPLPPEATLGDYLSISFDDRPEPVTDEQVEESIRRLLETQATWEDVDGPAEPGDSAEITGTCVVNGEEEDRWDGDTVLVGAESAFQVRGFSAALTGMRPGESKSFTLEIAEGYDEAELVGKAADFEVTLSRIRRQKLPELNDELVKGLGEELQTVADLRSRIRENLEARANQALRESLEEKVLDELVGRSTFELAPLQVDHEAEHILYDQQQTLARYNISMEQFNQQSGRSADEMMALARESAEKRLKRTLAIDRLAEAENIEVSDEEVAEQIELLKAEVTERRQRVDLESDENRQAIIGTLKRRKAIARSIEIAQSGGNGAGAAMKKPEKAGSDGGGVPVDEAVDESAKAETEANETQEKSEDSA